jgi:ABC-type nitrate/sulfonate/bicarbonate transport system permease component
MTVVAEYETNPQALVAPDKPDRRGMSWRKMVLLGAVIPVIAIVGWELWARSAKSVFFPPPSTIVQHMYDLWLSAGPPFFFTSAVVEDILPSLGRMLAGWAIAGVVGIVLGIAIGRSRTAAAATTPVVNFLRSLPSPVLVPVFLLILGADSTMRITLIAFGCVWPVLLNTIDGTQAVEPTQLDTARAFGVPRGARIMRIVLPSATPKIYAGLSVALAIALVLMVISELTISTDGIGFRMNQAAQFFQYADMWAGIILIAILGSLLTLVLSLVERRALAWYRGSKRHED